MHSTKLNKQVRVQLWRDIVKRASQHPVSCHAFCVEQGISQASFYSWRNKLSKHPRSSTEIGALAPAPRVFSEVKVSDAPGQGATARELSPMSAKWVAELILHLQRGL